MMQIIKRYQFLLIIVAMNILLFFFKPSAGWESIKISADNLLQMIIIIPPIFLLLGLFDVWVPRETMIKLMGEKSGLMGMTIAFILGSVAAGPLYAAFPISGILLKKGSKFFNVLIFIGAWSTTKIPLLLFEASTMGWQFMSIRFFIDIPVIILIAYITEKTISTQEKRFIYENSETLG